MNGLLPIKAVATGGRQIPNNEGNIFDHIDVFYEREWRPRLHGPAPDQQLLR